MQSDFFGSFETRGKANNRSKGNAYGVIIIINRHLSRAVCLELSTDYNISAFSIAFRRLITRGNPSKVFSDSGSQLKATNQELKQMVVGLDKTKLHEF